MAPGLVPQIAAWRRRLALTPAPARGSGEASNGQPVQVELYINGAWVDITGFVMVRDDQGKITITSGVRDEGSQTEQSTNTLPLKNADGRFTRRNPLGPYYGFIGRNTPCRISVPDGMGGKAYRQWCEISKWPKSWDPSGNDVWVDVSANGILQRLAQSPPPERSVIYNAITNPLPSSVVAYWPMEDATGATQLASALTTGSPMTWTGVPTLASYSGLAASDPLPDISAATLSGGVAKYDDPTASQIRFLAYIPKAGLAEGKVVCAVDQVDYSAGSAQFWELYYSIATDTTNSLVLRTCASDGTNLGVLLPHTVDVRGRLLYVSIELQESGTSITRAVRLKDVLTGRVYTVNDTQAVTQLTRVTKVQFGPASRSVVNPGTAFLPGVAVGHCTVENAITAIDALGVRLNPIGETAGRRIQRLCAENGLPFDWVGDLDDTTPMGAQGKANAISLIQECVLADNGLLYESRLALGLGYRTRTSLYTQTPALTLDYTAYNLAEIPTPVEDDRYLANKVVVSVGGVTATYEQTTGPLSTAQPPAGVGAYGANKDSPLELNLASTDTPTLLDQAAWRVHVGTVDEDRFPQIGVNLAHPSITPDMRRAILGLRMGDRLQLIHPPLWVGPDTIDQLVIGVEESLTAFEHRLTFTCQPSSPYNQIGYLDSSSARVDIDSQLLSAIGTGDTTVDVIPALGQSDLWTIDPAEFPFDIRAGGEIMRVTNCTPKVSDTFTRTTSSSWGSADTGQAWTNAGGSASDFSTNGTQGLHSLGTVNVSRYSTVAAAVADVDVRVSVATSALATGGSQYAHVAARFIDTSNGYFARLAFNTDQTVTLTIQKRVAGGQTDLTAVVLPFTHTAATFYWLRLQVAGGILRAKAWQASEVEVPIWYLTTSDSALTAAGGVGVRSVLDATNTNTLPVTVTYDSFQVTNPQTLTVTRSMNGVVKAHSAGEALSLAYPNPFAL
ncbi:hypothetical protein [Streptomyces sp. NPDC091215]|uniref:hypothetical protein n=1 Tax=Streptomyces sp. NPDC091215 TaxID=3155192 RepID=UPI003415F8EF